MKAIFVEVMFHIVGDLNDLYDQISPSSIIRKKSLKLDQANPTKYRINTTTVVDFM
jgi:hypothetical protein